MIHWFKLSLIVVVPALCVGILFGERALVGTALLLVGFLVGIVTCLIGLARGASGSDNFAGSYRAFRQLVDHFEKKEGRR